MKTTRKSRLGLSSLTRGPGKFKVTTNSKGEICIGNNCFRMRAADDGIKIAFNPSSKGCPKDMSVAMERLTELVLEGKPTEYRLPKAQEEGW